MESRRLTPGRRIEPVVAERDLAGQDPVSCPSSWLGIGVAEAPEFSPKPDCIGSVYEAACEVLLLAVEKRTSPLIEISRGAPRV